MAAVGGIILCLAYILGLLSAAVMSSIAERRFSFILALGLGGLGLAAAFIIPRIWRTVAPRRLWLTAATLLFLAPLYFQLTVPQPGKNDISQFVAAQTSGNAQEQIVRVRGKITSTPRLTRSKRAQFWLNANQLNEVAGIDKPARVGQSVTGKLYVTVPLLQATGLNSGQEIDVTGSLYKPKPPANPGSFDFQAYLAKEGAFAALTGRSVSVPDEKAGSRWGWWRIRQRILRSQASKLGIPEGPFVSAMVLGSQAVNLYLPAPIRDQFAKVGLAHALAASGFQVSLILAIVGSLTGRLSARAKFGYGVAALLIFLGLTGPQAPVLRAVIMGIAALTAMVQERKIKPFGSLLLAATILLLINPLWIQDLSFQLSFLATLGLLTTVPALMKGLDWLPPVLAGAIALPIAASIWTLPLQLYVFNVVSPYSILVNVISTPLITIISIGGFISALAGLIWPLAGSAIAWPLYYPAHWLIQLVEFCGQLPGNSVAVGAIALWQLIALYGLIAIVWLWRWWQRRWWLAGLIAITLLVFPVWYAKTTLFQVTVLATPGEPILIIQDQGKITLVNSGDANTARFTVLPFLQQQGVNQIDAAIRCCTPRLGKGTDTQVTNNGWSTILERLPITNFYNEPAMRDSTSQPNLESAVQTRKGTYQTLAAGRRVETGSTDVKLLDADLPVLQLQIQGQNWLLLGNLQPDQQKQLATKIGLSNLQVLAWSGERLTDDLLKVLKPSVAIASSSSVDPDTVTALRRNKTQLFWTNRDGAIQWSPKGGFEATLELTENEASLL
ncbi:ComEC/Rec2 family competence protein [Microseira wollei]|uniref:ComEC/Rec2-related protein n=1 Tax=Microseira wollei NIES-4236 TaxID=2530354 RepID=A0AAV3XMD0_9CYAN|nr:ComEC/Rec2 family competence protein [Microseira wollei]GET41632.1 ComEC/Rec2-related protein [Microseira wollei NIES-4236]